MSNTPIPASARPSLGVVIRFKDSAATLPAVLESLHHQTVQPDVIIGVNNGSTDSSADLLRAARGKIIDWTQPYNHSRVLNFALRHCPTDLVLILSSHTVLRSPDAIERLVDAMTDPRTACASARWDEDPFYSDVIGWQELKTKGLKFGSIYSNSMGMIRRSLWEQVPFDESLPTMEDSAWALEQLKRGYTCHRVRFLFDYQRSGKPRHYLFAVLTFQFAARHGLSVTWLGADTAIRTLLKAMAQRLVGRTTLAADDTHRIYQQLLAWAAWRFVRPINE